MVPYKEYIRLKPLALKILYSLHKTPLNYIDEINKCGTIIKALYENTSDTSQ